jgi:hypothetical protein
VSVAHGARIEGSTVGDVAGVLVKDVMINVPRADMSVPEAQRIAEMTDAFLADLRAAIQGQRLAVFFDAVEKMSADTKAWAWQELLAAARDGKLPGVLFVLCGQQPGPDDREWIDAVEEARLQPLQQRHVVEYLTKRGLDDPSCGAIAETLVAATGGKISEIAKVVDTIIAQRRKPSVP